MPWKKVLKIGLWLLGSFILMMLIISTLLLIYKEDIKKYALEEANQYLNKRVHVSYIDVGIWKTFPNLTLSFDEVLIYDKFDTLQTVDTAIFAQKLDLKLNLSEFYNKNYSIHTINIKNGKLNLRVLEDGRINYDFLKKSEDTVQTPFEFNLHKIKLQNVDFSYANDAIQQYHSGFFKNLIVKGAFTEKQFTLSANTDFLIKKIQSKALKLIENQEATCKIQVKMDQENSIFEIESALLKINGLPFNVKGKISDEDIDFYIGAQQMSLVDFTKNFAFQELDKVKKVKGKGTVDFELFIKGEQNKTTAPAIDANFSIANGSLTQDKITLTNINLSGNYSNGINRNQEELNIEKLQFHTLNNDFNGQLKITQFERPRLRGSAKGMVDLQALHLLFGPFNLPHLAGKVMVDGNFDVQALIANGNVKDIQVNNLKSSFDLADIIIVTKENPFPIELSKGHITLRNQVAGITDFNLKYGSSSIVFNGELNQVADYFNHVKDLLIDAEITSQKIVVDELITNGEAKTKDWILPGNISGNIGLDVQEINYSGHQYTGVKTKVNLKSHQLDFSYLEGINAQAKVKGSLQIIEESPMYLIVKTNLKSDKVLFQPLFKEWNNFDQEVIKAENIQGQALISLKLIAPFDLYNQEILKEKFEVETALRIENGQLINVETFKQITESLKSSAARLLISKNKIDDFEKRLLNLKFDAFENELRIKNGVITIPRMTIYSNAIDVTLEGTHSFNNEIDYSFAFKFRDLKGQTASEFGDIIDDETGFIVYLKMGGTIDKPTFAWDKEAKKKAKEQQKEEAKEDFKSALKTGFGIHQNDSTIQKLEGEKTKEDKIYLDFGNDGEEVIEEKEEKKSKLKEKINRWKQENKEENENEFSFE